MNRKQVWIVLLLATTTLFAQNAATVTGTVKDASGATVPKAQVTATNVGTSLSRSAVANDEGEYVLEFLPVGEYRVEVNMPGFKKFVRSGLVLEVNQTARVDVTLQVGAVTETLTVVEAAPLVNTENAALGRVTENKEITELPIVDRNVYGLLTLTAGVENNVNNTFTLGFPEQRTNINGGSDGGAGSVSYYLDGGSNMNGLRNTGAIAPNPDAVQEFKLITNSYSAEYGHFSGGVVTILTKSGTNALHGSLFEFLRNDKMAAKGWNLATKAPLHRNQFGGTLGGPVKKDKLFFFGSYGGLRQITPQTISGTVPSALERTGDFSQTLNSSGKVVTITDPLTGKAFPNNLIPAVRMDQTALNVLNYYAKTGLGYAPANQPLNVYQGSVPNPYNSNEYLAKMDYLLSSRHTIAASYYVTPGSTATQPGSGTPWSIQQFNWWQHVANLGDTWSISPTMINEAHLNFTRFFGGRLNLPGTSIGDLGSKFTIQGTPSLPNITVSGYATMTEAIGGPTAGTNFYELRDTLSIVKGRHTIKVGGSMYLQKYIQDTLLNNYGTFNFSGTAATSATATASIGNGFAAFLLGLPQTMNQDAPITAIDDGWYYGAFAQDDWRVTPRLTINAGLRWDLQAPLVDPFDRKLTFQQGAKSTVAPNALPGLLFPGDPGIPRGIVPYDKHQFGPRLGLAWDPFGDGKTSVRAGAGIFFGSISGNEWNTTSNNQPFAIRQQFNAVKSFTDVYGYVPGGDPYPYTYNPSNPKFLAPTAAYGVLQNFVWPYTYQLNFSIQRQILKDLSVTASYVGSLAHRLPFADDLNYPIYNSTATTANVNNRRPILPGTYSTILMITSMEQSSYNAFQFTVEKRLSQRFMLKGFYTFSKSLSDLQLDNNTTNGGATDYSNLALDRGRTDFDRRNNIVVSLIWKPDYFGNMGAFMRTVFNGWTVSNIISLRSGLPINVTTGKDNNLDGTSNDRPLLIGNAVLDPGRSRNDAAAQWFNPAAFQSQTVGDGTTPRNFLDGPGTKNVDMAIFRDFKVRERMMFQFRGEMTNAFNLVNLGTPSLTESSATFGRITTAGAMRVAQLGIRMVF
jgi:outer membrane receptor protein involved in Fe transport